MATPASEATSCIQPRTGHPGDIKVMYTRVLMLPYLGAVDEDVDGAVAGQKEVAQGDHHVQREHAHPRDPET